MDEIEEKRLEDSKSLLEQSQVANDQLAYKYKTQNQLLQQENEKLRAVMAQKQQQHQEDLEAFTQQVE